MRPGFYYEEYYTLYVLNDCGQALSQDTILTTDYIYDPEILKDLHDCWYPESVDKNPIAENELHFYYDNTFKSLHLIGDFSSVYEFKIFDIHGKCVKKIDKIIPVTDLSDLEKGIYLAVCITKSNKITVVKFIK